MSALRMSLEMSEKALKLPIGPTSPRPGPTLEMQVTTEVKVVTRSKPSSATSTVEMKVMVM